MITWQSRQSVPDLWRQYLRYGRGKADVAVLHPGSLQARHLAAPVLVAWLAAATAVAVRRPGVAVAMVSPYVASVAAASAVTARRLDDREDAMHLPAAFVAMHVGWGVGFWLGAPGALVRTSIGRPGRADLPDLTGSPGSVAAMPQIGSWPLRVCGPTVERLVVQADGPYR